MIWSLSKNSVPGHTVLYCEWSLILVMAIVRRVKRTRMREIMRRRGGEGRERSDQESGGNRAYWFLSQNTIQMCLGNL